MPAVGIACQTCNHVCWTRRSKACLTNKCAVATQQAQLRNPMSLLAITAVWLSAGFRLGVVHCPWLWPKDPSVGTSSGKSFAVGNMTAQVSGAATKAGKTGECTKWTIKVRPQPFANVSLRKHLLSWLLIKLSQFWQIQCETPIFTAELLWFLKETVIGTVQWIRYYSVRQATCYDARGHMKKWKDRANRFGIFEVKKLMLQQARKGVQFQPCCPIPLSTKLFQWS